MCRKDGDRSRFRTLYQIGDRPAVLFLGRRDGGGKGYRALLEAWPRVVSQVPEALLLLAGPGDEQNPELKAALPSNSIRDLGVPDETLKADALAACDVFCLPSALESFGIAYVEAWSYGKPVICGTAPACRELIQNGINGRWSSHESRELADCLCSMLSRPSVAAQMGEAGRRLQLERYTEERMVRTHSQAFFGLS